MYLPVELAMEIGSFLTKVELRTCTDLVCKNDMDCVLAPIPQRAKEVKMYFEQLIELCTGAAAEVPPGDQLASFAQQMIERIELYLSRHPHVKLAILFADIRADFVADGLMYLDVVGQGMQILRRVYGDQFVVQWHVVADSMPAGGALPSLHTLDLQHAEIIDVSPLSACQSLHTLFLGDTAVADVSPLAACPLLHTLDLSGTAVTDVRPLAACPLLHTLNLGYSAVTDVSPLASCQLLHTLNLGGTAVTNVSALASCPALHTLELGRSKVTDVSALVACLSLHAMDLSGCKDLVDWPDALWEQHERGMMMHR
jgi:Leucine-rich repeat (LRR) protein